MSELLQLKLEEWGENIKKVKIFRGHNNKEDFLTGGRTWQYFLKDNKEGRYDLFKLSGTGQVIIPYPSLKTRPPFTNIQFIEEFENKFNNYFKDSNNSVKEKFFTKSKPSFSMQEIIDANSLDGFLDIWDWVIMNIEEL